MPSWALDMLRRRKQWAVSNEWGVLFTSPTGLLRDPSDTQADLRGVFGASAYPWVISHAFRKTAAILLDDAGVPASKIADQLGQAQVSVTQDYYLGARSPRRTPPACWKSSAGLMRQLWSLSPPAEKRRPADYPRAHPATPPKRADGRMSSSNADEQCVCRMV